MTQLDILDHHGGSHSEFTIKDLLRLVGAA